MYAVGNVFRKRVSGGALAMVVFATTIFISATLLFLIEPMFAKFVLPSFGGTPAVWTGSMMFFQAALLTSYLYVHLTTTWLGARRQAVLHLAIVGLPLLLFLLTGPIDVPAEEWAPAGGDNPLLALLALLFVAIGLPFFAVSATNPLIQRWLADTDHPSARDPYFLYMASNAGSVIGLLGYPLLVEPSLNLDDQGVFWTVGYGLLVALVVASAFVLWRSVPVADSPTTVDDDDTAPMGGAPNPPVAAGGGAPETGAPLAESVAAGMSSAPTLLRRLRWIGLAFVPSSLMLGVTAFTTTNVTPVPLLWVIPLSLYLFSFVIVFSPFQRVPDRVHKAFVLAFPAVMALLAAVILTGMRSPYLLVVLLHLLGFFVVAMVMHGELARDRPPARNLTEFYLWVALGGVLGGVFNALIAPAAFNTVVEYPLMIVAACLFLPGLLLERLLRRREEREEEEALSQQRSDARGRLRLALDLALPVALGLVVLTIGYLIDGGYLDGLDAAANGVLGYGEPGSGYELLNRSTDWDLTIGLAAGMCLYFAYVSGRALRFGLGIAALVLSVNIATASEAPLYQDRSFFGVYQVSGEEYGTGYRALVVGDTNHGAQILGPVPPEPIAYHERTGPFGQLFDFLPEETTDESEVAVLGLGAGAMSCYMEPGQQMTFYEVDPKVEEIARDPNLFTYLRDCEGEYDVVIGDGRLKIAEAEDASYGMIAAEAFSSDAIPVHLMTREAIDLYLQKLQEDGVLVFNIANRYLDLEPVLGNVARDRGLVCYNQFDTNTEENPNKLASIYTVMARDEADLGDVPDDARWQPCATDARGVWTDGFSNLLSTFEWNL